MGGRRGGTSSGCFLAWRGRACGFCQRGWGEEGRRGAPLAAMEGRWALREAGAGQRQTARNQRRRSGSQRQAGAKRAAAAGRLKPPSPWRPPRKALRHNPFLPRRLLALQLTEAPLGPERQRRLANPPHLAAIQPAAGEAKIPFRRPQSQPALLVTMQPVRHRPSPLRLLPRLPSSPGGRTACRGLLRVRRARSPYHQITKRKPLFCPACRPLAPRVELSAKVSAATAKFGRGPTCVHLSPWASRSNVAHGGRGNAAAGYRQNLTF